MSKHTPTPWKSECINPQGDYQVIAPHENATSGHYVCKVEQCNLTDKQGERAKANAAFIVEACNAYKGLNAAIDTLAVCVERIHKERDGLRALIDKAVDRLYEIVVKHGGDIEGVTRGRITACATRLNKQAIALCDGEGG